MPYAMKSLSYDPARIKGMSETLIISHYENNYGGAAKRLNSIEARRARLTSWRRRMTQRTHIDQEAS